MRIQCSASASLLLALCSAALAQGTVYVNAALTTGLGDGSSWPNAFRGPLGLQQALQAAAPDAGTAIWVASGTYIPSHPQLPLAVSRTATFAIPSGVRLLGGFAGNEVNAEQRLPGINVCTLSGDQAGDGSLANINTENSAHVVSIIGASARTLLDGFVISGGIAENFGNGNSVDREHGAGVLVVGGSPVIRNCRITGNRAEWFGAGICIDGAVEGVVENCTFTENTCGRFGAGAAAVNSANSQFRGCTFENNIGGSGIGIFSGRALLFNTGTCTTLVEDCHFRANNGVIGATAGGGVLDIAGRTTIRRCFFDRNIANGGGAAFFDQGSVAMVDASRFFGNGAEGDLGDAVYSVRGAIATLTNCAVWGHIRGPGSFTDGSPIFANGGAVRMINCAVVNNGSSTTNPAAVTASGANGFVAMKNSIVWGNFASRLSDGQSAARALGGASLVFDRCIVQGWAAQFPGANNSGLDPGFMEINGVDGLLGTVDDDLHLLSHSPCVDAGSNDFLSSEIEHDLDLRPRRQDHWGTADTGSGAAPIIDIGPYEFIPPCRADANNDGVVGVGDLFEYLTLYFADCAGQSDFPCSGRSAELDGQPGVGVQDLFAFLSEYFVGCA